MEKRFRHCIREHDQVWDPLEGVPCEKEGREFVEGRLNEAHPIYRDELELRDVKPFSGRNIAPSRLALRAG